ncbi:hypothetical protein LTR99_007757 [Exophiala xenobiotica]|nr:hypothetical protein LTR99_007757 [Exophiala xenobiotica]KAK5323208.1 hypothetical protein LTR93_005261 [Exophiala xenobiotica]KAK5338109.1 hypothetical protein LTR98_005958 [Exophiala xenobiotica]KAK5419248.1 hypothetical protein LTR90_004311 [Exophiala xenobiotica]KAK5428997.1 hypothetical protein LTR34_007456 [Exophiala xenobiotica]
MFQYSILFTLGLWCFQNLQSTALRAVALGMLFPGAGLVAVCTIPSLFAFVVTLIGIPVTLFVWFAMGGVLFPLLLWFGSAGLAGILAKDTLFDKAGPAWGVACVFMVTWAIWKSSQINARGRSIQLHRNKWLPNEVKALQDNAVPAPAAGSRELDLKTLRFLQHMIERGLTKHDDLSYHDVIDQFQTGAVRYQLYGVVDSISLYLTHYAPGFHGYAAEACRNCIEKSLTKKIMSYWKWERLTGKFTTDYDPINYDNIMVTGYLGVAIGLYASATGDRRYEEKGCLDFHIADGIHFKRSFGDLADAMYQNMATNDYCLYPCEPNWTYSLCNLIGMAGLIISSRLLGNDYADRIKPRFERALEDEMTEPDGRILPIRSELTGLTIPGLSGTLSDCINAMNLTAYLPHIGSRVWAIIRREHIYYNGKGRLDVKDLRGADKMDPGNYKGGVGALRAFIAGCAAEFGDEKVRVDALEELDTEYFPVEATESGALRNKGLSATSQVVALMARLMRHQDLANATLHGPEPAAMQGPLLADCKFPEVLVAKAYSHDSAGLDLVLYNGKQAGTFTLGFERLTPGGKYSLSTGKNLTADKSGKASVDITIDGRTELLLSPA